MLIPSYVFELVQPLILLYTLNSTIDLYVIHHLLKIHPLSVALSTINYFLPNSTPSEFYFLGAKYS